MNLLRRHRGRIVPQQARAAPRSTSPTTKNTAASPPARPPARPPVLSRLLASYQGKPGSIPSGVAPGFPHARIVPGDHAGRWVFSGSSPSPPPLHSSHFTPIGSQNLDVDSRPRVNGEAGDPPVGVKSVNGADRRYKWVSVSSGLGVELGGRVADDLDGVRYSRPLGCHTKLRKCWPFRTAYLRCDVGVFDELHASRPLGGPAGLQVWAPRDPCRPRNYDCLPLPRIIGDRLMGPCLLALANRVNGARYHAFIANESPVLLEDVPYLQRLYLWFMHDGALVHFPRDARERLTQIFNGRWIGRGDPVSWPSCSPDLNPLDFWLWGHLKALGRVIYACQHILDQPGVFQRARDSLRRRSQGCITMNGRHIEHFLSTCIDEVVLTAHAPLQLLRRRDSSSSAHVSDTHLPRRNITLSHMDNSTASHEYFANSFGGEVDSKHLFFTTTAAIGRQLFRHAPCNCETLAALISGSASAPVGPSLISLVLAILSSILGNTRLALSRGSSSRPVGPSLISLGLVMFSSILGNPTSALSSGTASMPWHRIHAGWPLLDLAGVEALSSILGNPTSALSCGTASMPVGLSLISLELRHSLQSWGIQHQYCQVTPRLAA
ncbi:hypothetical protein PR048_024154 [Dryococelus australis]|uniref:Uncharacterized protein n=1 Tax=Dryococelus australis TaxID=614101 RepID=A0ABQ9GW39_9NEOP|nr:hypothetical protein PR048_024154 [Dryococelus australis]